MQIVPLTPDKYKEWNKFCLESDEAWFWHTTDWLTYTLNFKPELNTQNLSFLVYKGDVLQAVVPLTLEIYQDGGRQIKELSFGGWAILAPALVNNLSCSDKEEILNYIFGEIDLIAEKKGVVRAHFRQSPLSPDFWNKKFFNRLMEFGYLDVSFNTL